MTSLDARIHAAQARRDECTQAVAISPSSTSSISDSVFSNGDARSSQSSAPSSVKGSPLTYDSSSDLDSSDAVSTADSVSDQLGNDFRQASLNHDATQTTVIRNDLRRHPRRTCARLERPTLQHESATCKSVPTLTRQCDRKERFVEALVDTATEMIEVIWPMSKARCSLPSGGKNILDLRKFVQEVLRRSKTSHSTLQVALFYLMMLIPFVPTSDVPERPTDPAGCRALRCGRRMFLAALILASKYLQDRNYTMSAWAKISGLKKEEICFNELAFLKTVNYDLHVPEPRYKLWTELVYKFSVENQIRGGRCDRWRRLVPFLTADLAVAANAEVLLQGDAPASLAAPTSITLPSIANLAPVCADSPGSAAASYISTQPPQFLEPKVTTSADLIRFPTSPKPSKLETPCLPPINFDCSPAASRSQLVGSGRCPSMGMAMQRVSGLSMNRASVDGWSAPQRRGLPCSRRSCLSSYSSASSPVCLQTASQIPTPVANNPLVTLPAIALSVRSAPSSYYEQSGLSAPVSLSRESYLRASSSSVEPERDATEFAARGLLDLRQGTGSIARWPTPESMSSMTDGSSVSDADEVATPKVADAMQRPLMRTARKRERPSSLCEADSEKTSFSTVLVSSPESVASLAEVDGSMCSKQSGLAGLVRHRGGVFVDYGSGVDGELVRSRAGHLRSSSGSHGGVRKKARPMAMR